jgi:DNA end-binding protein Ku
MLHKDCGSRLKQQYICPKDNDQVVTRDEMVKGYEFAKGQYVVMSPDELKALEEKATGQVEIIEFVPLQKVGREFFERAYYLGPEKGSDRAYRLLVKAMEESGKAALGQYAARGQQHLVLLHPRNGRLVMEQLHYVDEIRPADEVPVPEGEVKEAELNMAKMLIEQSSKDEFDPSQYKDTVRERVMELIQQKVAGQDITASEEPAEKPSQVLDLMEALKASLDKGITTRAKSAKEAKEPSAKKRKAS